MGATVVDGRLNGVIAVTRSLGDFALKQRTARELIPAAFSRSSSSSGSGPNQTQSGDRKSDVDLMLSEPEVRCHRVCLPDDDFLVLGSDGVFDAASVQDLSVIIRTAIDTLNSRPQKLKEIKSEPDIKTADAKLRQLQALAKSDHLEKRGRLSSVGAVQKGRHQSASKGFVGSKRPWEPW